MIKLNMPVRDIQYVACSGGVDSMALLHFLKQANPNIQAAFFNHNTETSHQAERFVLQYCLDNDIPCTRSITLDLPVRGDSPEEFWRRRRYEFLHNLRGKVATAHHLNDVAETYLFGCIHGQPKFIGRTYYNVVRPILSTTKDTLYDWCERHGVPFIEDETNNHLRYNRNRIRHNIMPEVQQVNPGFLRVVDRLQQEKWDSDDRRD